LKDDMTTMTADIVFVGSFVMVIVLTWVLEMHFHENAKAGHSQ
jgi:hypothetical protein